MNYTVGPGNPYGPNDDFKISNTSVTVEEYDKYITLKNVLIAVAAALLLLFVFLCGVFVGGYMKETEIKEFPDVTTTEEPTETMNHIVSWVEEERTTTTKRTTTTEETTTTTTTETTTTSKVTTTTTTTAVVKTSTNGLTALGSFKGTYYAGKTVPCKGGSGRTLVDCSTGSSGIKGSVASKLVYQNYGYKRNGERTKIYIEVKDIPSMTGWYYVDDCNSTTSIIDFYYYRNSNCPFQKAGVISVKAYI